MVIVLVQKNKKELKNLISCVKAVYPKDIVIGFEDPQHALGYAEEKKVDVCYADVEMPTTSGFALTEALRKTNKKVVVNLIADCTDYAVDAWRMHVNDYLLKPVTKESVRHTVAF